MRVQSLPFLFSAMVLAASVISYGQETAPEQKTPAKPDDAVTYVNPETARLAQYVGSWKITENHFSTGGQIIATATGTEEVTWILNRRAIQRNYSTATEKSAFQAIGILAWNSALKKYDGVWFNDSSTLGPTTVKGDWPEKSDTLNLELEAMTRDGTKLTLKVVERHIDNDNRVNTTYSVEGEQVVKRLEVEYHRVPPCPATMRVLGG